jgi:hypothetical protein
VVVQQSAGRLNQSHTGIIDQSPPNPKFAIKAAAQFCELRGWALV